MNKLEALQAIKDLLEESLDYFDYFETSGEGDEHADIYWDIKDIINSIDKRSS